MTSTPAAAQCRLARNMPSSLPSGFALLGRFSLLPIEQWPQGGAVKVEPALGKASQLKPTGAVFAGGGPGYSQGFLPVAVALHGSGLHRVRFGCDQIGRLSGLAEHLKQHLGAPFLQKLGPVAEVGRVIRELAADL